jgi:MOSC domain-containing protein YiiM
MQRVEGTVVGLARDGEHRFSKVPQERLLLVEGHGVEGDAHAGATVQHRSRVAVDPSQPNLRQVHLLAAEFLEEARRHGYVVTIGDLGENVLTSGIDLLGLPRDTLLHLGPEAVLRITGLRNPCAQIETFRTGLLRLAVGRDESGAVVRKAGVMAVVVAGGTVGRGDIVTAVLPPEPHHRLERV